ncbi:uncharacterized protein [Pyxicephalus adspersus]
MQTENVRKSITEKLPGLRSHHSNNHSTEIMDNKINANFGLKAKKSVIHPRSASSNKTRFSLSSEKSDPNGLNMSPVNGGFSSFSNTCPHDKSEDTGHSLLNDDIEKKVHVNKDGSLSVEMKVRFRLLNEETLQWSTQIKKSSTSGKAKCEQLCLFDENGKKEMNPETYSETDESFYPCDGDSYSSKLNDAELDLYCAQCGMQCQDYDIWKNPMHANPQEDYTKRATWQTRSSASSASSHHKLMSNQKASIDSICTMSSEEYMEHVVHKSSCYAETRENSETMIRYSRVSQCTSRSGRSTEASNVDASSDTARQNTSDNQRRSRFSHRSPMSSQNQQSQHSEGHLQSERGSLEHCSQPSPTPISDGESCSQKVSSQSKTSQRRLLKRDSTNTKSLGSNCSYNENEETDEIKAEAKLMNTASVSSETEMSEDHQSSECIEQPVTPNELITNEGHAALDASSNGDCDKCSSRANSFSKASARGRDENKGCSQNGDQGSCSSLVLSSISKENSENVLDDQESLENCEVSMPDNKSTCSKSNRKSFSESRGQSFQSNRSQQIMSPVRETDLPQKQMDSQVQIQEDDCNKSLKSHSTGKSADNKDVNGQASLPVSRSSSKPQSFSSKYNKVSCLEKEKHLSTSSSVPSTSEKKGQLVGSSEICDRGSIKDSARTMSRSSEVDEKLNDNVETCSGISALENPCIQSPSPPKDNKPVNKQLRSSHYKYSSNSMNSETLKNKNGERIDSSRSSTPTSKGLLVNTIENCKMLTNAVSANDSTENIYKTKKRKNSSSSSKRKLKVESLDGENNLSSGLTPSALPNVSSEEVVNEWLKKIPSETMVVEYEECQKKGTMDVETESPNPDSDKKDNGDPNEVFTTEEQNNDQSDKERTNVCCPDNANQIADANLLEKEVNESDLSNNSKTNNVKDVAGTENCICDKKSLPNNIHTSVQIMKALLNPLQESKLDRSNSLPEVSQTMGRKLSNSAQVLISCLAGLQLLNDGQTKNSNDTKYIELFNIFQALWAEGPTGKKDLKSAKHYSRDDELTPVSSSGVDINSGFDGSGDGSITGGGNSMATEKSVVKEVNCVSKNLQNCNHEPPSSGDQDTGSGQTATTETVDAGFDEAKSYVMDENMNEKKIDSNSDEEVKKAIKGDGSRDAVAAEEDAACNKDTMNNLSHNGNEAKPQESKSEESNDGNSSSRTTIISTSDSNGKNNPIQTNDQTFEADPVWVLKLLKKIEKEFMTHYVDAMNEFKVRWNLENNDNLNDMIAELKNEVSQRIQRSISNELKKIKSRAGIKMPRPPNDGQRRKSSLQAEERRRRLQTLHRRSMHGFVGDNLEGGTNDSCETDEEELTFSASFADDSSGQGNDEFCPCEKCIKQKRALKLAKPRAPVADAPIVRAFDLQQILKMKRENNEPKNDGQEEVDKDVEEAPGKDCPEGQNEDDAVDIVSVSSKVCDEAITTQSEVVEQDGECNEAEGQEDKSVADSDETCETNELQCEPPNEEEIENKDSKVENQKSTEDLEDEAENSNADGLKSSVDDQKIGQSIECPPDVDNPVVCEDEQQDQLEDETEDSAQELPSEHEEVKETSDPGDEQSTKVDDESSQNENCHEEEDTANPVIKTEENSENEDKEAVESYGLDFQRSCLGQGSLITHNGSVECLEECKETNNTLGETSPNGQSNSSGSKQSQMYPDSSSEEEEGDSPPASPVGVNKSEHVNLNNKGSFEDCDDKPKKYLEDDIIDQDDLDF